MKISEKDFCLNSKNESNFIMFMNEINLISDDS